MFVDLRTVARIADIDPRNMRKAVAKIANGDCLHWRGYPLEIITLKGGRGGSSGDSYAVSASSLPPDLQDRLKALQTRVEGQSQPVSGSAAARERSWWLDVLGPALEHPKGSAARKAALDKIAATKQHDWHGRRVDLSQRTLQRKLARMEGEGSIRPLARYGRADKGEKRTYVSRAWDAAAPFDDATKAKLAGDLRQEIRGLVKSGATWSQCLLLASRFLVKASRAYGFRPADPDALDRLCAIPKSLVSAEMHYRKVHRHKKDRKASEDDKPRVKRTISGLRPMDYVVMDVHPIDVLVTRADGTTATPKLLGFLDAATQRVWCELIFFDNRGGVRNIDQIEAFLRMAQHPSFGLPKTLHCDNGKETGFADFLDDAMKLVPSVTMGERPSSVIRSLPYNAAAKPIEQWFGRFEQQFLKHLPGWIGGDRMKKKQEAIGRTVAPFAGGFEAFQAAFYTMLAAYEHVPQLHGQLGGKSPATAFAAHVADGWAATVIDPEDLLTVFTKPVVRNVSQHAIQIDGRTWTGPELDTYFGDKATVRLPLYHGFNELLLEDGKGNRIGIVRPQEDFTYHDPRGAQSSAARTKARNAAIRQLDHSAPDIDMAERLADLVQVPVVPGMPVGTVKAGAQRGSRMIVPEHVPPKSRQEKQAEADEVFSIQQALLGRKAG